MMKKYIVAGKEAGNSRELNHHEVCLFKMY
jgi:hypothetical protein